MGSFIVEVLSSGVVSAALLGLAAWLGKQQISAWLNKDLERLKAENLKELEAKKAEYQRELESYRVSLIAAAERSKAEAEIKKAGALLIVEKKFKALDRLHSSVLGAATDFLSGAMLPTADKTVESWNRLLGRWNEISSAFHAAETFLSPQQRQLFTNYRQTLRSAHKNCAPNTQPVQGQLLETQSSNTLSLEVEVDNMIRSELMAMMTMQ